MGHGGNEAAQARMGGFASQIDEREDAVLVPFSETQDEYFSCLMSPSTTHFFMDRHLVHDAQITV
jgi:hypothetical protein